MWGWMPEIEPRGAMRWLKSLGIALLYALLFGGAWYLIDLFKIPDIAIFGLFLMVMGFRYASQKEEIEDLKYQFEAYRTESEEEIETLNRRIVVIHEDIDQIHPDGKDRYIKGTRLGELSDLLRDETE